MAERSRTQKVANAEGSGRCCVRLRSAFSLRSGSCVQLRSAFACVQTERGPAFSCVQDPAFSCVLRSPAFCVQLRSAFCVRLRSAFSCVLRSPPQPRRQPRKASARPQEGFRLALGWLQEGFKEALGWSNTQELSQINVPPPSSRTYPPPTPKN